MMLFVKLYQEKKLILYPKVSLRPKDLAGTIANALDSSIAGSMSNDGWPRCAVALLTTDKPDDNTRCLQALACCSLALLLFASDDTKIVEELLTALDRRLSVKEREVVDA